jgi:hypothetical protein
LLVLATPLEAREIRVGSSAEADFPTIQPALDAAEDGDSVVVEPGEYVLGLPLQFNRLHVPSDPGSPALKDLVLSSLEGAGRTILRVSEPPFRRELSVAFLFDKGRGGRSVVEGFTVQAGSGHSIFEENRWRNLGAAVTCIGSSPTFRGCRFVAQEGVPVLGALIHLEWSSPRLIDCAVEGGRTGLFCVDGAPQLEGCRLAGADFGGAELVRSSATFSATTIEDNENASGLRLSGGSLATLTDCVLRANDGEPGGGFLVEDSEVHLLGSTIEANGADDGGGGFAVLNSRATLVASTITGNYGDHGGGAFESVGSDVLLESCLLTGNFGEGIGDAFLAVGSEISLVHCTVSGNGRSDETAGLVAAFASKVWIEGSILWGNDSRKIHLAQGATVGASFSCIQGAEPLPGRGNIIEDPLFLEPGVFDFSDLTYRPKFIVSAGNYRLRQGSSSIDLESGGQRSIDPDGTARPCGAGSDAGAYETGSCLPERFTRGDMDVDGSINVADAVRILGVLFLGHDPPGCFDAADAEDDGRINLRDPIYILGHLFLGGPAPPPPLGTCGPDPTSDDFGCDAFPVCP